MSDPLNPPGPAPGEAAFPYRNAAQDTDALSNDDFEIDDLDTARPPMNPRPSTPDTNSARIREPEWVEPEHIAQPPRPPEPQPERPEEPTRPEPEPEPEPATAEPPYRAQQTVHLAGGATRPTTQEFPLFDDVAGTGEYVGELRLAGGKPPAPERPSRRPPLLVWVFTALFIALMAMCTFLYPAFSGYDEAFHVDMTYSYYNGNGFYDPGDRLLSVGVDKAHANIQVPPQKPLSDQKDRPRGDRKSFDAYGGDAAGSYPVPNQMVQHPPLYYAIGAGILRLFPNSGGWPYDQWVAALRYLSILMVAPLPILAWATTKNLVGGGPAAVTAAAIPLTIPNLARVGGSVNNDCLLILLTGLVVWLLSKVVAGDFRKKTAVMIGVLTGLACLTKGFALALPLVVILGYGLAMLRHRKRDWVDVGITLLGPILIAGWWWVRNLVLYGTIQPEGLGKVWAAKHFGPAKPGFGRVEFLQHFFPLLGRRTWGGIGLPEVPELSPALCYVWAIVAILGLVLGVAFGLRGRGGRLAALLLVLPTLFYLGIMLKGSMDHYLHNGMLTGVQGRYLYPTIVAVAALMGVGYARLVGRQLSGWLPMLVVLGGLVTQVLAWRSLVHVWWVPKAIRNDRPEEVQKAFRGILRWSPWDHVVTTVPFVAVIALSVAAVIGVIAYGGRGHGDDEPYISDDSNRRTLEPARY
ncbi:MAG TPA: DUF2142 domain-containing protein [Mycobacteriales bacterium]|nr:DUF2142 domain-containing protein [Mycobacteriales bacterium]